MKPVKWGVDAAVGAMTLLSVATWPADAQAQLSTPAEAAPEPSADALPDRIHVDGPQPEPTAPLQRATDAAPSGIEEVIVTAAYREQRNQDVAGSTQAFSGKSLDEKGAAGLQDYLLEVPSVSFEQSGNGSSKITMRGISNVNASDLGYGDGSPTTGIYLDDVAVQGSGVFPDLDVFDLQRIEVLKGPQGTLYGEGSMGGAIKMVTNAPKFNEWAFRTQGAYSETAEGSPSSDVRAAVNVPLIDDTLAARIVGNVRHTGGFVDYTSLDRDDANSGSHQSARAIVSYQALESLSFDYTFMYDNDDRNQFPVVDEGAQDELTNSRSEDQYAKTRFTINALTARWNLDFAQLTAVSALYNTNRDSQRRTPVLQNLLQTQFTQLGLTAPDIFSNADTHVVTKLDSFSQELRLVSTGDSDFGWIAGAFYRVRSQTFDEQKYENSIPDDPTGILTGILSGLNPLQPEQENGQGKERFDQLAVYSELNYKLLDDVEITGGLRAFTEKVSIHFDTDFYGVEGYLLATDPSNVQPDGTVNKTFDESLNTKGLLPKFSMSWHITPDKMLYASVARGFRSGTPNIYAALDSGPAVVKPDYVWNKEIGAKLSWLDDKLITNFAVYHIDWQALQGTVLGTAMLGIVPTNFAHLDNAGNAVVYGAEASTIWAPLPGLQLSLAGGYNHGRVTDPRDGSQVVKDSETPSTPEFTGSATIAYGHDLGWFGLTGDSSVTYTYTDKQQVAFEVEGAQKFEIAAYELLKATLGFGKDTWHFQFFGDNLLDKHAIVGISAPLPQYTVITPRVVGARISYDF
jgi:iron complex outermembrane receptor protein